MKYIKSISTAVLIVLLGVGVMTMIVALTGCSTQPPAPHKNHPYSGDHRVAQLRGMFSICLQTRQRFAPFWPVPMHIAHCDCIVDKSREKHSSSDYNAMKPGVLENFFRDASAVCDKELNMPSINNEPVKPDPATL